MKQATNNKTGVFPAKISGTGTVTPSKTGRYIADVLNLIGLQPGHPDREAGKKYIVERFLGAFINGTCTPQDRKLYLQDLCISYHIPMGSPAYLAIKGATFDLVKHFKEGKANHEC